MVFSEKEEEDVGDPMPFRMQNKLKISNLVAMKFNMHHYKGI